MSLHEIFTLIWDTKLSVNLIWMVPVGVVMAYGLVYGIVGVGVFAVVIFDTIFGSKK